MQTTLTHNDKLLTAFLSDTANNRAEAVSKILNAARNASSLEGLRTAIEHIAHHMERVDCIREESLRNKMMA